MVRQSETSWTTWAVVIVAVVLIGWFLLGRPGMNQPRNQSSADQSPVPPTPVAPEITVRAGTSAKAPIGDFSIRVVRVAKESASLVVSSGSKDTYRFKKAMAGQRLMIPSHDGTYYIDIKRVGGGAVSLSMGAQ